MLPAGNRTGHSRSVARVPLPEDREEVGRRVGTLPLVTAPGKWTGPPGRSGPGIRALMATAVASAVLAAAACSPEGGVELGQATSDDRRHPCDLLTTDEIDNVHGWALPAGERPSEHEADGQAVCSWEDHRVGMVHLQLYEGDGAERFEQLRGELESIGEATDVEVPGADAAWEDPTRGIVGILVGEHLAQVGVWGPGASGTHLRLAEIVAGRL